MACAHACVMSSKGARTTDHRHLIGGCKVMSGCVEVPRAFKTVLAEYAYLPRKRI